MKIGSKRDMFYQVIGRMSFCIFLVFLHAKLMGGIEWSWWLVTAPIWAPSVSIIITFLIGLAFAGIAWLMVKD